MKKLTNRFDVHVSFSDHAFGIKSLPNVEVTPEIVATELEAFCKRIRDELAGRAQLKVEVNAFLSKGRRWTDGKA